MGMELIEVEAFLAIVQAGGFTRAATRLRLSQPAISRRIDLLERELGAPLFERGRGTVRLTAAGAAFLPYARAALAATRDGAAAVRALGSGDEGDVTLALVGTLASTGLVGRLRAFQDARPGVRLALRTARSDEVGELVRQGDAALGLRYFPDPSSALDSRPAGTESLVAVCAAHSRLVGPGEPDAAALAGGPWVGFPVGAGSSGEPFARLLGQILARAGLDGVEVIPVDSLTAQKRLVEADFGLGLLPASCVEEELRVGTLRLVPVPALAATVPIFAVTRRDGYLGPAAMSLLAILTSEPTDGR